MKLLLPGGRSASPFPLNGERPGVRGEKVPEACFSSLCAGWPSGLPLPKGEGRGEGWGGSFGVPFCMTVPGEQAASFPNFKPAQRASVLVGLLWCVAILSVVVIGILHSTYLDLT